MKQQMLLHAIRMAIPYLVVVAVIALSYFSPDMLMRMLTNTTLNDRWTPVQYRFESIF